jgi:hypothetical protein
MRNNICFRGVVPHVERKNEAATLRHQQHREGAEQDAEDDHHHRGGVRLVLHPLRDHHFVVSSQECSVGVFFAVNERRGRETMRNSCSVEYLMRK